MILQQASYGPLTVRSFFSHYMFHPCEAPTSREKKISYVASIALGFLTVGIAHLVCYALFYKRHTVSVVSPISLELNVTKPPAAINEELILPARPTSTPLTPIINRPVTRRNSDPSTPIISSKPTVLKKHKSVKDVFKKMFHHDKAAKVEKKSSSKKLKLNDSVQPVEIKVNVIETPKKKKHAISDFFHIHHSTDK